MKINIKNKLFVVFLLILLALVTGILISQTYDRSDIESRNGNVVISEEKELEKELTFSEKDSRIFKRVSDEMWHPPGYEPKEVSLFLKFEGPGASNISTAPHGIKTRSYVKVWDNLYLQVYSQGHAEVKHGEFGYYFSFSKDKLGNKKLLPIDQPSHGVTANDILAYYFRNNDNSGPIEGTPFSKIMYEDFAVEIRLLEFEIINTGIGKIPSFASFSCLLTVKKKY